MRVTFLLPRYPWHPSGGYSVAYTYASLLAQRGHTVSVVHPRRLPPGGWPAPVGALGVLRRTAGRVREFWLRPSVRWANVDPRVQLLFVPDLSARHVPDGDAIIATWWSTAEAMTALPDSKGRPFHLIQGYETWHGSEDRVIAAWRSPAHKIVIAGWLMRRALELGVPASLITLIPVAIPLDVFRVIAPIGSRPPRVAMLYSTAPFKGGDIGIRIIQRARERVPALRAVLFGVGSRPRQLPHWIEYVSRASPEQLAADVYNRSAVYLCASSSEGWHLPPAEAMACGCAVVSSDIDGVADYAVAGDTALLYPVGDVEAGAERLIELLTNDRLRAELAERGLAKISTFSWERSAVLLEALLESSGATPGWRYPA